MAPSHFIERVATTFTEAGSSLKRALDVQPSPSPNVLAADAPSSMNRTSLIIILSVVLGVIGVAALIALFFIVTQRKQLRRMRTIRVIYNVDNLPAETIIGDVEKAAAARKEDDEISVETMDGDAADEKPQFVAEPSNERPHVLSLPASMRRKKGPPPQPLTIIIPSGVYPRDVQIVNGEGSAAVLSASTKRSTLMPNTAVSSAISTAAINVVQDKVYVSNGWAPATIVYLPKNPKNARTPSRRMTARRGKTPRTAGHEKTPWA